MLKKNKKFIHKLTCFKDGEVRYDFTLDKSKLLLGSGENCDLVINDPTISFYHAFIHVSGEEIEIIDLKSQNGIFSNGERVQSIKVGIDEAIQIGPFQFKLDSLIDNNAELVDQDDQFIEKVSVDEIIEQAVELTPIEGLHIIDGEYCDIVFDEVPFDALTTMAPPAHSFMDKEFIDVHESETHDKFHYHDKDNKSIKVTLLSLGNILSIDHLAIKDKNYNLVSQKRKNNEIEIPILDSDDSFSFINVSSGNISVSVPEGFQSFSKNHGDKHLILSDDDVINLYQGSIQILIEIVDTPPRILATNFFQKDPYFIKQSSKIIGAVMGLMLLLLFVDTSQKVEDKRKIAIIYKPQIKSNKISPTKKSDSPSKTDKDLGVRKKKIAKDQLKRAKKATKKKKIAKKQAPPKPVKKAIAKAAPKVKKAPKMKAYKFKMAKKFSSLMNNKASLSKSSFSKTSRSVASVNNSSMLKSDSKALNADSPGKVSKLGKDFSGSYDSSTGAAGLASKSGIDTAATGTKTIVMGSMDPELLRKILREYLPQFRYCYQQELERNELFKGIVDLKFRINKTGKAAKVNVIGKSSKFTRTGSNCMRQVLSLIDFPKPKGGGIVDVKQPLNFQSERGQI